MKASKENHRSGHTASQLQLVGRNRKRTFCGDRKFQSNVPNLVCVCESLVCTRTVERCRRAAELQRQAEEPSTWCSVGGFLARRGRRGRHDSGRVAGVDCNRHPICNKTHAMHTVSEGHEEEQRSNLTQNGTWCYLLLENEKNSKSDRVTQGRKVCAGSVSHEAKALRQF